jgi:squalene synthase HpnC
VRDRTGMTQEQRLGSGGDAAAAQALVARAGGENFPVALRFLPARRRRYLLAVYGFARTADDIGDLAPPPDRPRLLAELEADLGRLRDGTARRPEVRALGPVIAECAVPLSLFSDLIQANRQDQVVCRYERFEDLLGYCRLSANPVGRVVLHVFGAFSEQRAELSDHVCTALQLAEHWQDIGEDLRAGRVYLPREDMDRFGCRQADLAGASAAPRLRELIAFEVRRAGEILDAGAPVVGMLRGTARAAVAGYVAGGRAALAAIAAADHDVLSGTPLPRKRRVAAELLRAFATGR